MLYESETRRLNDKEVAILRRTESEVDEREVVAMCVVSEVDGQKKRESIDDNTCFDCIDGNGSKD